MHRSEGAKGLSLATSFMMLWATVGALKGDLFLLSKAPGAATKRATTPSSVDDDGTSSPGVVAALFVPGAPVRAHFKTGSGGKSSLPGGGALLNNGIDNDGEVYVLFNGEGQDVRQYIPAGWAVKV